MRREKREKFAEVKFIAFHLLSKIFESKRSSIFTEVKQFIRSSSFGSDSNRTAEIKNK